ncbi:MAG: D-alanine--D-alanine ligase [Eubacteriales bacterium]|nr:D-alanine--D-alanine ligase [Eubacteriales bacterium]
MKITVLSGGLSTERDVAITSGKKIAQALRTKGHKVVLVDVFMGYEEDICDIDALFEEGYEFAPEGGISTDVPNIEAIKEMRRDKSNRFIGEHVLDICAAADITFLALHGGEGENGQLQATLDLMGIRYTGAPYLASAVAMHKGFAKSIFLQSGVSTPMGKLYDRDDLHAGVCTQWDNFPCVVKPCSGGSSVGVSIVKDKSEYEEALSLAFKYDEEVLVEEYIKGRELSVGLLDGKALPIIEIIPKEGFYDYKNKYQSGAAEDICPAVIDEETTKAIQNEAEKAFAALGLEAYSRIDFILTEDNRFYCIEANNLPGMTPLSLLPQEAKAVGIDYPELCDLIVELSLKKYALTVR